MINFNPNTSVNNVQASSSVNPQKMSAATNPISVSADVAGDFFVKQSKLEKPLNNSDVLSNRIWGDAKIQDLYNQMAKSLNLPHPPTLTLVDSMANKDHGGGFNFAKNQISLNLEQYTGDQAFIMMEKGGKTAPFANNGMKVVVPTTSAARFVEKMNAKNNGIVYSVQKATDEDLKKVIEQTMYHELVHAQQHEVMRRTEGIGAEKLIINKGINNETLSPVQKAQREAYYKDVFKNSPWAELTQEEAKIPKNSKWGKFGCALYEAAKDYTSDVRSPKYASNLLEKDAYKRALEYIVKRFHAI